MKVKKILGNVGKYLLADGRKVSIQDFKDGKVKPIIKSVAKPIKKKRGRKKKSFFSIEND